jgi:5'-3' exonuclease
MSRLRKRFLDCKGMTMQEAEAFGQGLAEQQRDVMFQIGDLARYAESRWPDTHYQVWPEWVSPGMIARAAAVSKAYPREEDRQADATYTIYMREANQTDRLERIQAHVDAGRTSDEARKANQEERPRRIRWLLAIDVNYFLHRSWFSGAGVEAAARVASWVQRTVARLKEKGLTDVACCFDSLSNHRKELTSEWEDKYKDRPPKDPELVQQLQLVRELLEGHGFSCVSEEGMEADDIMASFAAQFDGRVTIFSQDKDVRQCLSDHCNILLDVEWTTDETSGDYVPEYKWLSAKQHTEDTGIRPDQWTDYQSIMGDNVDGVKGAAGIGEKGAAELIETFGTVEAVIEAAKSDDERIKPKKREALIEFESKLEVTRQLVTLRRDLKLPGGTRI